MAFALITSTRRLRPYFQAHDIQVLTDHPLRQVLHKPDASRRLVKWAIESGEFNIKYLLRTSVKGQDIVDFLVEFTGFLEQDPLAITV